MRSSTWVHRVVLPALLVVLLLTTLHAPAVAVAEEEAAEPETLQLMENGQQLSFQLPASMVTMTDATFQGYLFPKKRITPRAFLVMLYSPWCPHCKGLLPQFINASRQLERLGIPHSTFAVADVQQNRQMGEFFDVNRYPGFIYTTNKGDQWHNYDGVNAQEGFMQFAAYLQRAVDTGSFSEDVTEPARFDAVEAASGSSRVPCYVYIPQSSASKPENQRTAKWSQAIDGAASVSNIRFSVLYESAQPADWAETASPSYKTIVETAKACAASGQASGPDGEVLVVDTDRYRTPKCYTGPWTDKRKDSPVKGEATMSVQLESFLALHGFHAVEDASASMFDTLSHMPKNYLGVIMCAEPIDAHDDKYVPVLREITQAANDAAASAHGDTLSINEELRLPRVSWSYIDAVSYPIWRARYNVQEEDLPVVMIIDTVRDRYYKMRTRVPRFEAVKLEVPWKVGGEQHRLISTFVEDVLADKFRAEKLSTAGWVAETLSQYPGYASIYAAVQYDDFVFDVVVMVLGFFTFLLFIAVVVEPLSEKYEQRQKKKQGKVKTD